MPHDETQSSLDTGDSHLPVVSRYGGGVVKRRASCAGELISVNVAGDWLQLR